ncbi:MAG: zf-HC2 domain-containing protein, partial [Bacteroidota bacterium]
MSEKPMRHREIERMLPEYLRNGIGEEERIAVRDHLADCEQCRRRSEELERLIPHLDAWRVPDPPVGYFTNLVPRVRQAAGDRKLRPALLESWSARIALPFAAAILVMVLLTNLPEGFFVNGPGSQSPDVSAPVISEEE